MKQYAGTGYDRKYEAMASDWRDREFDRYDKEQQEYEDKCEERWNEIMKKFRDFHKQEKDSLKSTEWSELEDYIREYPVTPETSFDDILDDYTTHLVEKYNFLYK